MESNIEKLSRVLNIPVEDIKKAYSSYWKFIKNKIEDLPLKEDLSEEEYNKLKTNFNIINLGKMYCTYDRYKVIKTLKKNKNAKHKEDKTDS